MQGTSIIIRINKYYMFGEFKRTLGKVILVLALCCRRSSPVLSSKRKTEKARWRTPRCVLALKRCDPFLLSDPMTLSSSSRTRTVSLSIMSSWVMALPSHVLGAAAGASALLSAGAAGAASAADAGAGAGAAVPFEVPLAAAVDCLLFFFLAMMVAEAWRFVGSDTSDGTDG